MKFLAFVLNLPWTILGLIFSILSIPKSISFSKSHIAIVFDVRSFWWYSWLPNMKYARGMAIGHVVLLGKVLENDLEHELVHVKQSIRTPLIHPFLYFLETMRKGYRNNKYEVEAYGSAKNLYVERK